MSNDDRQIVWSSEQGDLRKKNLTPGPVSDRSAGSPKGALREGESLPPQQQTAYLHRDKGGRGGKVVTLVKNLVLSEDDLKSLSKQLKQACGAGGTVKDGMIEIQGGQREKIAEVLRELGYKVKVAGG